MACWGVYKIYKSGDTAEGVTLIELLVVLGIIVVLASLSVGVYISVRQENRLDAEAQKIVSVLRLAQNKTLASESFTTHGVYFDAVAGSYTLFEGTIFDALDPKNETMQLSAGVMLLNVQLTGGGTAVIFNRLSGVTTQTGFIELASAADTNERRTMCIKDSGSVTTLRAGQDATVCVMGTLEYTDGTTAADVANFPSNSGLGDVGQSFTVGSDALSAYRVDLLLAGVGSLSNIFLEIRDSATIGEILGTSAIVSGASLPASLAWTQFTFSKPVPLLASTQYFLRLRSLPSSTRIFSGASGTVQWGYEHAATSPPAYASGDAWRYIGAGDNPLNAGQQLGPVDQYDFSFRVFSQDGPNNTDSRHLEFNVSLSLRSVTTIDLIFNGGVVIESVAVADFMNGDETVFSWEGDIDVATSIQTLAIHSLYIDDTDTILSVHRDRRLNDAALAIELDGVDLVTYLADGTATKGANIESMIYR